MGAILYKCKSCIISVLSHTNWKLSTLKDKNAKSPQLRKIISWSIWDLKVLIIILIYNKYNIYSVSFVNKEYINFEMKFYHIIISFQSQLTGICVMVCRICTCAGSSPFYLPIWLNPVQSISAKIDMKRVELWFALKQIRSRQS